MAEPTPPRVRRWPRRLLWLVLAALLLLAGAGWGLPALLKSQLPPRLGQALGRPVTLDSVAFVPWRLELTLTGLRIGAAGAPGAGSLASAAPPLLQVDRLQASLSLASLRHRAPVVEALAIDGLQVHVARTAAGHYDIDDLLQRLAAPPADPAADAPPTRFALYNLALRNASLQFDDRPTGRVHALQALTLTLPLLSNLPADVAVSTQPRLAFTLNGTRFDSGAQALPFATTRSGQLTLAFKDLDLAPWLGYLPDSLPLRLRRARLSTDLALRFSQPPQGQPSVALQGRLALHDVALTEPGGAPLATWQALGLELRDVQPLLHQVDLGTLRLDGATLQLARDDRGQLNLQRLLTPADSRPARAAAAAAAAAASVATHPPAADARPWRLSLAQLQLGGAQLRWTDDTVRPRAALQLDALALQASGLRWPAPTPLALSLQATLRSQRDGAPAAGTLQVEGQANDRLADLQLTLADLDLAVLAPYAAQALRPRISGQLAASGRLHWAAEPAALSLSLAQASLRDLQLHDGPATRAPAVAALRRLQLDGVELDLLAQRLAIQRVQVQQPEVAVVRDARGQLNLLQWVAAPAPAAAPRPPRPAQGSHATATPAPWQIRLQDLALDGGRLRWTDAAVPATSATEPAPALRAELSGLRLRLQGLAWPAPGGARATLPRLQLAARLGAPVARGASLADSASIDWNGRFGLAPLQAQGRLRLQRLPLHLFAPYAGAALPVALRHADAGFQGEIQARDSAAGWQVSTGGDLQINELLVHARPTAGDAADPGSTLLSWQSLALQGLDLALAPPAKPRLLVREATLNDFYSRLDITEQGHFNLQDVAATPPDAAASGAAGAAAVAAPPAASAPPAGAPVADAWPIDLDLGSTQLRNGRIDFSDHFIRPNYSARLTELNGQIGRLRSGTREMARISLRGRAADTALIDISGQLNPTAKPLALDIRAKATDLELAPLSPYAGKYAGYAIERGKLSMDVAYKIDDDGKLQASNQVILNQLTFGDKVDSPSATQLPVLLAVALLKDRHGVIDINLPVSGSVNDPQFSVGGIVWKLILNLLGKALTAPFALLAGGGSDDLSLVEFQPGTARFSDSGRQSLAKVATALADRPGLTMTVTGAADPAAERDALQRTALDERLQAEHRRQLLRSGAAPAAGAAASAPVEPAPLPADERARLLKSLYQQTALPNKPRNALGLLRDLPPAEMETLLLASVRVTEDSARELALQRGLAVRDALITAGLPSERLFLAAPKLHLSGEDTATWTPRVQLTLSSR